MVTGIGAGAIAVQYFRLQEWVDSVTGLVALDGLIFDYGLPGMGARALGLQLHVARPAAASRGAGDKSGIAVLCPQNRLTTLWVSGGQPVESCRRPPFAKGNVAPPKKWAGSATKRKAPGRSGNTGTVLPYCSKDCEVQGQVGNQQQTRGPLEADHRQPLRLIVQDYRPCASLRMIVLAGLFRSVGLSARVPAMWDGA